MRRASAIVSVVQRRIVHHAVHQADRLRLGTVDDVAEEIKLARLGGADQACQQPGPAEIAGQPDLAEPGAEAGRTRGDAHVARERDAEPGADRAPLTMPMITFGMRAHQQWNLVHAADAVGPLLEAAWRACCHRLHVATGAEAHPAPVSTMQPTASLEPRSAARHRQRGQHLRRQRVQSFRPVERQRRRRRPRSISADRACLSGPARTQATSHPR